MTLEKRFVDGHLAKEIAKKALEIQAIKLNPEKPFQWASGYFMPIYNDNRMFLFNPDHRKMIVDGFYHIIESENILYDLIAGTSTAGIPHGYGLAEKLDVPFIYVRDKPKDHGLKNQIEGIDAESDLDGHKVIVIEDLISTGGSSMRAVQAVRDANAECNYCLSIFSYGLDVAVQEFKKLDPKCFVNSLLDYDTLLNVAREYNYLDFKQIEMLREWRRNYKGWGEKHGYPKTEELIRKEGS